MATLRANRQVIPPESCHQAAIRVATPAATPVATRVVIRVAIQVAIQVAIPMFLDRANNIRTDTYHQDTQTFPHIKRAACTRVACIRVTSQGNFQETFSAQKSPSTPVFLGTSQAPPTS